MSDLLPLVAFRRLRPDGVLAAVDDHFFRLNSLLDHPLMKKKDAGMSLHFNARAFSRITEKNEVKRSGLYYETLGTCN